VLACLTKVLGCCIDCIDCLLDLKWESIDIFSGNSTYTTHYTFNAVMTAWLPLCGLVIAVKHMPPLLRSRCAVCVCQPTLMCLACCLPACKCLSGVPTNVSAAYRTKTACITGRCIYSQRQPVCACAICTSDCKCSCAFVHQLLLLCVNACFAMTTC